MSTCLSLNDIQIFWFSPLFTLSAVLLVWPTFIVTELTENLTGADNLTGITPTPKVPWTSRRKGERDASLHIRCYDSNWVFIKNMFPSNSKRTKARCPTTGVAKKVIADFIRGKNISWWRWDTLDMIDSWIPIVATWSTSHQKCQLRPHIRLRFSHSSQ